MNTDGEPDYDPTHNYYYTSAAYDHSVTNLSGTEISGVDCYHPSAYGQKVLSRITWEDGPFSGRHWWWKIIHHGNYILYSGRPSRYHQDKSAKLGEIWLIPEVKGKTRLVLVDALHPLCDKRPQPDPRYKWAYNGLIAGTDPVAVETVCLKILTEKRQALRGEPWPITPPPICVEAADKAYGLGTSKME